MQVGKLTYLCLKIVTATKFSVQLIWYVSVLYRWLAFGKCVQEYIGHCHRTWHIWKLWNQDLPLEQRFTDKDMQCSSAAIREFSQSIWTRTIYILFLAYWMIYVT